MNNIVRKALLCVFVVIVTLFTSCESIIERGSKEVIGEISEKTAKRSAKEITEEFGEKSIKEYSENAFRHIDWDDAYKLLKKENAELFESLSRYPKNNRKLIVEAMQKDYKLCNTLLSSRGILDEFSSFTKNAPKLFDNIDFFKIFANADEIAKNIGTKNPFSDMAVDNFNGNMRFFRKSDGSVLAKYRDGVMIFDESNIVKSNQLMSEITIFKNNMLPNGLYKIKGDLGTQYLYHVGDLGEITKIEAKNISPNDIVSNIIHDNNLCLDAEWNKAIRTIKQTSKGSDVSVVCKYKYVDGKPKYVQIEADVNGKNIVDKTFQNLDDASFVKNAVKKIGLSPDQQQKLIDEMVADQELAKLIRKDPDLNVQRWLNTRNHVDKYMIVKTPKGKLPPNAQVYAGNVYYFNPHLNNGLYARLRNGGNVINLKTHGQLTYNDLIELDKMCPDGVPFTKEGFPDFSKVAFMGNDGKTLKIDIGELSGNSQKDISKAETIFQSLGYKWENGYTWHHVENTTTLIRIPTIIHQLVDHAGGMSMAGY